MREALKRVAVALKQSGIPFALDQLMRLDTLYFHPVEWAGVFTRIEGVSAAGLVPADGDPLPTVGTVVHARLDDVRRRQLMRTHSGLHVVCGVVYRDFGAIVTGSGPSMANARSTAGDRTAWK